MEKEILKSNKKDELLDKSAVNENFKNKLNLLQYKSTCSIKFIDIKTSEKNMKQFINIFEENRLNMYINPGGSSIFSE